MMQFDWRDEYKIDGGQIDEEHRKLLHMANAVFAVVDPEKNRDTITKLVQSLFRYMETHFANEEQLMREIEYPDLEDHSAKHQTIVSEMTSALQTHRSLDEYLDRLQHLMVEWVIRHIADADHELAAYFSDATTQAPTA